ncbi:nitroimidazol reductase NimA-like FMN-containing flavoprotein (pyridoxamine 5'-phosphate oxidase superfamily) [Microbacteriaceae bacterium SG_E_30_P1]|uniref:Nitroimidazol reductase NimA-like FMN-containing flavoprotein (Pyridoxamine 5'-phosphate oxidase superfamily) n=1 Tax=Antiquaquibacter oligotrophicus TaxID=2880260 RepID=A0ABT6KRH8_9MICO|nr:pyridoxamine 5'-phosphate oxidase family protein [Antiquaquibacter oligotrophicus]MDH6182078.1 nitroimidazol reductase NimA-like FMN-containing flavoprotein (pyridoxamine 5'-phosphate oxidase superfamily) [Antiquaquibacter oligotrophicus]UDF12256.1 pyridoxamine 5'-phosphate oxidase family protein [Antiquaquibacter oligotrophicus]
MVSPTHTSVLDEQESWSRLRSKSFGRLAVSVDNHPDVFPVNFLADDDGILVRTEHGTKVDDILLNPHVAFEVDDVNSLGAWSVVVTGVAEVVADADEIRTASAEPVWAWAPGLGRTYLRIRPTGVTGRLFRR